MLNKSTNYIKCNHLNLHCMIENQNRVSYLLSRPELATFPAIVNVVLLASFLKDDRYEVVAG